MIVVDFMEYPEPLYELTLKLQVEEHYEIAGFHTTACLSACQYLTLRSIFYSPFRYVLDSILN